MKKGFTLIEVMVVVAVIGVMMAAGIVAFTQAQKKSRDAKRRADVDVLAKAYEFAHLQNGDMYGSSNDSTQSYWTNPAVHGPLKAYFPSGELPLDPINGSGYFYHIASLPRNHPGTVNPRERFGISAKLEVANGNCSGHCSTLINTDTAVNCPYVNTGLGTHYCRSNLQ